MAEEIISERTLDLAATYAQAPGQALEQLRQLADGGDISAIVLVSYGLLQQNDAIDDALPYATQAMKRGIGAVAQTFAVDLANRGREDLRARAPDFIAAAIESGWTVDLRNLVWQALSQGRRDLTKAALSLMLDPPPPTPARAHWDELVAKAQKDFDDVTSVADIVRGQRESASTQIAAEIEQARDRGAEIERLANDLGVLANVAGSVSLARSYADRAAHEERLANRYTYAWLGLAALSVVSAGVIAFLTLNEHTSVSTAAQRAAFAIPVALFAAVISRLAHAYRQQAWKLRHVELQIKTSNPFLAGLDESDRKKVLADLALRFFPGQSVPDGQPPLSDTSVDPAIYQLTPEQLVDVLIRAAQGGRVPQPPTTPESPVVAA